MGVDGSIRLTGTQDETSAVAAALRRALDVREESDFYPNRGRTRLGRVYLDVEPCLTTPEAARHD